MRPAVPPPVRGPGGVFRVSARVLGGAVSLAARRSPLAEVRGRTGGHPARPRPVSQGARGACQWAGWDAGGARGRRGAPQVAGARVDGGPRTPGAMVRVRRCVRIWSITAAWVMTAMIRMVPWQPGQMCSTTSSASTIRRGGIPRSATSVRSGMNSRQKSLRKPSTEPGAAQIVPTAYLHICSLRKNELVSCPTNAALLQHRQHHPHRGDPIDHLVGDLAQHHGRGRRRRIHHDRTALIGRVGQAHLQRHHPEQR